MKEAMKEKRVYTTPEFEIFKFAVEDVLGASGKPPVPELPEDEFRPIKVF